MLVRFQPGSPICCFKDPTICVGFFLFVDLAIRLVLWFHVKLGDYLFDGGGFEDEFDGSGVRIAVVVV